MLFLLAASGESVARWLHFVQDAFNVHGSLVRLFVTLNYTWATTSNFIHRAFHRRQRDVRIHFDLIYQRRRNGGWIRQLIISNVRDCEHFRLGRGTGNARDVFFRFTVQGYGAVTSANATRFFPHRSDFGGRLEQRTGLFHHRLTSSFRNTFFTLAISTTSHAFPIGGATGL